MSSETFADAAKTIEKQAETFGKLKDEIGRVIVGQEKIVDRLLIALVCEGHVLLEGVPGVAKTTMVRSLANAIGVAFQRVSFTPDLLPADVTGTQIYNPKDGSFTPQKGPVFTNILLADEINRAPAKVQSALLEAMQERRVTIGNTTHKLPDPFLVLATQNPIEQEGTYPLPEAQVDRFMFKCVVPLPSFEDERRILTRFSKQTKPETKTVLSPETLAGLRAALDRVYCDEKVSDYILSIVFATREPERYKLADMRNHIAFPASPRASLFLALASRANAMLKGRAYATPQDVKDVAHDTLRHRIITTYEAEAENVTSDAIVARILNEIPVP